QGFEHLAGADSGSLAKGTDRRRQLDGDLAFARGGRTAMRLAAGERPLAADRRTLILVGLNLAAFVPISPDRGHISQAFAAHLFFVSATFLLAFAGQRSAGATFDAGQCTKLLLRVA